jgi:hypothetical protein
MRWVTFRYLLKGRVGVLADSELDERRQMVLPSVLESITTQPPTSFSIDVNIYVLKTYENI